MKSIKYILLFSVVLFFVACFSDKSTDAVLPISEITIESGIDSVYEVDKNSTIVIKPIIKQSIESKKLNYTWEVNMHTVSHETEFSFVGNELGKFNCRLIVENEDGKTFFPFVVNVNSPYEYGITVLSEDEDGNSMLSFMQEPMKEGDIAKFTEGDCFAVNNEDMPFASHPTDIVQSSGSLIISCKGKDDGGVNGAMIYFLNEKTFVVENYIASKEYKDFKPTKLLIPSQSSAGISYPVLSADGKVYDIPTYNAVLQPSTKLFSKYSQSAFVSHGGSSSYDILLWDKEAKGLTLIYNAYGPYYCGSKYLLQNSDPDFATLNYFKDVKGFISMTEIRRTPEQMKIYEREVLVLLDGNLVKQKVVLSTFFWSHVEGKPNEYVIMDNGGMNVAFRGTSPINENTPCIANKTYNSLLFPKGNIVKRWYYTTTKNLTDADDLLVIDKPNAVITALEMSDDHKKTYVAFYNPDSSEELKGCVWVIDTDKGTILEQYDNVCHKPVKMIYKTR